MVLRHTYGISAGQKGGRPVIWLVLKSNRVHEHNVLCEPPGSTTLTETECFMEGTHPPHPAKESRATPRAKVTTQAGLM